MPTSVVVKSDSRRCSSVVEQRFRKAKPCEALPLSTGNPKAATGTKTRIPRAQSAVGALRRTLISGGMTAKRADYYIGRIDLLQTDVASRSARARALRQVALEAAREIVGGVL